MIEAIVILTVCNIMLAIAFILQQKQIIMLSKTTTALTTYTIGSVKLLNMTYVLQAIQSEQVRIYDGENVTLFDPSKRKH